MTTILLSKNKIPNAAPSPAPEHTPRISGLTREFWKVPCKEEPEIDNPAPTIPASITLGNLMLIIIWSTTFSSSL